jgi:hypothetical protein
MAAKVVLDENVATAVGDDHRALHASVVGRATGEG